MGREGQRAVRPQPPELLHDLRVVAVAVDGVGAEVLRRLDEIGRPAFVEHRGDYGKNGFKFRREDQRSVCDGVEQRHHPEAIVGDRG